jgi:hypothetical protein
MKKSFPLSALSLAMYAGYTELANNTVLPWFEAVSFRISMAVGDALQVTRGDLFIVAALLGLFSEILKATRVGRESLLNHGLSFGVFAVSVMLFLSRPGYGNSLFFMFLATTFFDVMMGFIITATSARRELAMDAVRVRVSD